jgi:hypothetical protein
MSRSRVRRAAHSSTHVVRPRVTGVAPSTRNMAPTLKRFRLNVVSRGFCRRGQEAHQIAAVPYLRDHRAPLVAMLVVALLVMSLLMSLMMVSAVTPT